MLWFGPLSGSSKLGCWQERSEWELFQGGYRPNGGLLDLLLEPNWGRDHGCRCHRQARSVPIRNEGREIVIAMCQWNKLSPGHGSITSRKATKEKGKREGSSRNPTTCQCEIRTNGIRHILCPTLPSGWIRYAFCSAFDAVGTRHPGICHAGAGPSGIVHSRSQGQLAKIDEITLVQMMSC